MGFNNTQNALDTALNAVGLSEPIAWEGTGYKQLKGTAYVRTTNLTATSSVLNIANNTQDNVGIYQIDVFWPQDGSGTGDMLTVIDSIYNYFKSNLTLTSGGQEVYIRGISRLPLADSEKAFRVGGVQVEYTSYF